MLYFYSGEQNFFNSSLHLPFCSSSLEFLFFFRFLLFSPTIPHLTRFEVMIFFSSRCTGFMGCLWVRGDAIKNFGGLEIRFSILICEFTCLVLSLVVCSLVKFWVVIKYSLL